jgi:hypothetical protein
MSVTYTDKQAQRYSVRRVPGILALAIANLIAADILRSPATFARSPMHSVNVQLLPAEAWGALWLVSGAGLIVAAGTRLSSLLHIFGGLSFVVWTAVTVGVFVAWAKGYTPMTATGFAVLWWMWGGVAAMLLVPLSYEAKKNRVQ